MQLDPNIIAAILGPMITALIGAATVAARQLRRARQADEERSRIISQATQEAAFIDTWLSIYQRLELPEAERRRIQAQAIGDLERTYSALRSVNIKTDNRPRPPSFSRIVRAVLLIPLQRPWAKVVRAVYYLFIAGTIFSITMISWVNSNLGNARDALVGTTLLSAMLTLLGLCLWAWARALNRPRVKPPTVPPPPAAWGPPGPPDTHLREPRS